MLSVAPVPFVRGNPAFAGLKCLNDKMRECLNVERTEIPPLRG